MNLLYKIENISKTYTSKLGEKLLVLDDISLDIHKNDFISIIGASGSGKSTLLNILATIDEPDSGSLIYFDNDKQLELLKLNDKEISKQRNTKFGFIFQFHYLLPEFTALENVMMPAIIAGAKKDIAKQKAEAFLNRVDMLNRSTHKPDEMSGGEQQRISIARSLINEPEIIFADEPTGNLDEHNSKNIVNLLKEIQEEKGLTIITATHSQEVAQNSKTIYTIKDKKLVK
jgi:ABC-type lipoprotein export system ATPase subunit